jgi:tetratricopeptide (TPR) repeat protein
MYLKGSKWSMNRRTRRSNPWSVIFLLVLIGGVVYINQVVVPYVPPLFINTPTATRPPESFVVVAQTLEQQGKYNQAILAYQDAIQADPKNPSNFISLARLQIYTGKYQDAITNTENALLISPNNAMAYALRGWALGLSANYLEGEGSLNKALALDRNNGIIFAYLAEVQALEDQAGVGTLNTLQKAIDNSRTAVSLAPDALETHRARGLVLEFTQNYADAAREFEAAIAINSNIADLHLALGRNYRAMNLYDKAIEEFSRANSLNPADPMPETLISRTYFTVGEFPKAIQFAEQAVKDNPIDPFLYGNLGAIQYRNKDYVGAIANLRLAVRGGTNSDGKEIKGLPLDYGRVAEYYYTYGLASARGGDCPEALQISQLLILGVPNDEDAVYNAGFIVNLCKTIAETGLPEATATITPKP